MNRSEARKFQMSQLILLEHFDKMCKTRGLKYFLVFGTLLGAIRHKGFIPWDVDIDVAMYRRDYEEFHHLMINQPDPYLYYEHYENEKKHISPHAVLRIKNTHIVFSNYSLMGHAPKCDGIYIDIFPIDNVADPDATEVEQVQKIAFLRKTIYYKTALAFRRDHSFAKKAGKVLVSLLLSPFTYKRLNSKIDSIMRKNDTAETEHVAILTDPPVYRKQLYPRSVFGNGRECSFEGHGFTIPEDAEQFLAIRYGDYMKLPPEEERRQVIENTIDSVDYGNTEFLHGLEDLLS